MRPIAVFFSIGLLSVAPCLPALAAGSEPVKDAGAQLPQSSNIAADDIVIDTAALHIAIKHIALTGTRLSKADLTAIFDAQAPLPVADRLARLSADHIAIPNIEIAVKSATSDTASERTGNGPPKIEKLVLRDLSLDDVVNGKAETGAIGGISATLRSHDAGDMQLAVGPTHLSGLDLAEVAQLFGTGSLQGPARQICASLDVTGVKVTAPQTKADLGIATVAIKDVKPSAAALTDAAGFGRLDIASLDFTDLRFGATNGSAAWSGRVGHGTLGQLTDNKVAQSHFDHVSVAGGGATVTIGSLNWTGIWVTAGSGTDTAPAVSGEQRFVVDAVTVDLDTLSGQTPPQETPKHFTLQHFEVTAGDSAAGTPAKSQARLDHFAFNINGMKEGQFGGIASLGYDTVDLSSQLDAQFDSTKHEFELGGLSLHGAGMGAARLSGRFEDVSNGLLSADASAMEAAIVKLSLRQFEIKIDNGGLFERFVAAAAKKDRISEDEVRARLTKAVKTDVPAMLNNGRGSDALVAALTKFIAQPKSLRIDLSAPEGISALDAILIKDPAVLLQNVEITASADE